MRPQSLLMPSYAVGQSVRSCERAVAACQPPVTVGHVKDVYLTWFRQGYRDQSQVSPLTGLPAAKTLPKVGYYGKGGRWERGLDSLSPVERLGYVAGKARAKADVKAATDPRKGRPAKAARTVKTRTAKAAPAPAVITISDEF